MLDEDARMELKLLLAHALERQLTPGEQLRLQEIMLQYNPRYRLRGKQWVDAGLVLTGSWLLADALAEVSG